MELPSQMQREEPSVAICRIVRDLDTLVPARRERAAAALHERGSDEVLPALIAALTAANRQRKRRIAIVLPTALLLLMSTAFACVFTGSTNMAGLLSTMAIMIGAGLAAFPRRRAAVRLLARYDDVRGVGLLTEALEFPLEDDQLLEIETSLVRLLPRLNASDAVLLNQHQRALLAAFLAGRQPSGGNTEFRLAILKALEQVGDDTFLPVVTEMACGRDPCVHPGDPMYVAAGNCLPFLRARVDKQHAGEQLLRASSQNAGETAPDQLLRPASGNAETPPEQLLRAAGSDRGPK